MYWRSYSFTFFAASPTIVSFCGGTSMSSTQIEMPARVARRKPDCISWSANTTVARRPHLRNAVLIRREISFFFSGLFSTENGRPCGRISDRIARPTVVAYSEIFGTNGGAPSDVSSLWTISVIRTLTREASSTSLFSYARITSDTPVNDRPSPLPLTASRVA